MGGSLQIAGSCALGPLGSLAAIRSRQRTIQHRRDIEWPVTHSVRASHLLRAASLELGQELLQNHSAFSVQVPGATK